MEGVHTQFVRIMRAELQQNVVETRKNYFSLPKEYADCLERSPDTMEDSDHTSQVTHPLPISDDTNQPLALKPTIPCDPEIQPILFMFKLVGDRGQDKKTARDLDKHIRGLNSRISYTRRLHHMQEDLFLENGDTIRGVELTTIEDIRNRDH